APAGLPAAQPAPPRALGARPRRTRNLPRQRRLRRLERWLRRPRARGRARRPDRRRLVGGAGRLHGARRTHGRAQRTRRRSPVPHRARRRLVRADARARARPGRLSRAGARRRRRRCDLPDRQVVRTSPEKADASGETAARVADLLVQTLAHFGIEATVIGQISGPRVTRYELQLAPGTKVSKVAALKDDLSYALATTEIRILAPIPGKQAVGVELPNLSPNLVTLGDIFDDLPATASPLAVWLGKDISGTAVWTDLARMPHLLIAGTTGSGKSGCINTL